MIRVITSQRERLVRSIIMSIHSFLKLSKKITVYAMGNKKHSARPRKRPKRFLGQGVAEQLSESDAAASSSASRRKLSLSIPAWISASDSSSCDSSSNSSSTEQDSFSECCDSSDSESGLEGEHGSGTGLLSGYRLVDLTCLQSLISEACSCKICGSSDMVVNETQRSGLASSVRICCSNDECTLRVELPLVPKNNQYFFDCNRRSVLAARSIGRGHSGLRRFCGVMNLPKPVSKAAFQRHQKHLYTAAKSVAEASMQQAVAEVKSLNAKKEQDLNVAAVTFDGTLMKRGFTSLHGAFTCIDWDTGLVLDLHVSTKYCQA